MLYTQHTAKKLYMYKKDSVGEEEEKKEKLFKEITRSLLAVLIKFSSTADKAPVERETRWKFP